MTSSFSATWGLVAVPGTGFKFPEVGDVGQSGDEERKPDLLIANRLELLLGSLRALLSQLTPPAPEKVIFCFFYLTCHFVCSFSQGSVGQEIFENCFTGQGHLMFLCGRRCAFIGATLL